MQPQRQEQQEPIRDGEIDLFFIYRKLSSGLSRLSDSINHTFRLIFRRKLLLIAFVIVGTALGYVLYETSKAYYTSTMTLVLANIRNEFIEDQLNKLSDMIEEENSEAIADRLDISLASAKQIKEMKFSNLDQDRVEEDSVLTGSPFRIELSLYDRGLFESMEPALTNYLENNRYFAKQKRIRQRQVENMVSKLRGEITSMDSMKTSISEPKGPVNGFVYGQPIDPTNLYRESISMYKEQVKLEADLEKLDNVEIVTGFVPRLRPTGPSLINYLAISALVSFIVGSIVALNLESKKRRKNI